MWDHHQATGQWKWVDYRPRTRAQLGANIARAWPRKGLEAGYTVLLEAFVPKERILEHYLNIAETGPLRLGFEAALPVNSARACAAQLTGR